MQLEKGAHSDLQSTMMGKAWRQDLEVVAAHILSQEAERDEMNADAQLTPSFLSSLGPS